MTSAARIVFIAAGLLVLAGCVNFTRPYKEVFYYQVDYPPPKFEGTPQKDVVLRVGVFNVAPSYQSLKLLYASELGQRKFYDYHQWIVSPGDMLVDLLERDMARSKLYAAVVNTRSSLPPQYELEGTIEEIYELDEGDAFYSVLAVRCTLFSYPDKVGRKEILFQKAYRESVRAPSRTPEGVVRGMSDAAAAISLKIQKRVNKAIVANEKRKTQTAEQ